MGRRNNSKPTIENGSLHEDSKHNGVRTVNITTSKNPDVKALHVVRMREKRDVYMVLVGKLNGTILLGNPGVDRRIILRCIFRKWFGGHGLD